MDTESRLMDAQRAVTTALHNLIGVEESEDLNDAQRRIVDGFQYALLDIRQQLFDLADNARANTKNR